MAIRAQFSLLSLHAAGVLQYLLTTVVILLALQVLGSMASGQLMNTFRQHVGAGNYTYYKLSRDGDISLVLTSLEGDADLYISDGTLYPDFENYELQAISCGEDVVEIPASFKRPIGIGIYGHPTHEESLFQLDVYVYDEPRDLGDPSPGASNTLHSPLKTNLKSPKDEEESIIWTIFVGILKIIFDILL